MRESHFIKQNSEKWHEFEKILHAKQYDPDKLSNLFIQITEDLSYAGTFYPHRTVRYYLNSLAQKIFSKIYRQRSFSFSRFWQFWSDELPYIMFRSRRQLLLAGVVFLFAMILGILSSSYDNNFIRLMLGESYVRMTLENIEKGDPMGVYKHSAQSDMFLQITLNNIRVSFIVFVFGLLAGIGSVYILIYNGLTLGAFQYLFHEHGHLDIVMITVWQHGALEISSIIIAGAAGIVLGRGLAFPGTYTRLEAFRLSANQGIKIVLGTVPLFIIAGFIESFITRNTEAPFILRLMVIIASFAFILFYFVWLPWYKNHHNLFKKYPPAKIPPSAQFTIIPGIINNAEIIKNSFAFIKSNFNQLMKTGVINVAITLSIIFVFYYNGFNNRIALGNFVNDQIKSPMLFIADIFSLFDFSERPLMILPIVLLFSWIIYLTIKRIGSSLSIPVRISLRQILLTISLTTLPLLPALFTPWITSVFWFVIAPFWFAAIFNIYLPPGISGIPVSAFHISTRFYFRICGLLIIYVLISLLIFLIFATPVMFIYTSFILDHITGAMIPEKIPYLIYMVTTGIICISLLFPFVITGMFLKQYSLSEIITARSLIDFFRNLPLERRSYGFQNR